jgi:hypothetical protein
VLVLLTKFARTGRFVGLGRPVGFGVFVANSGVFATGYGCVADTLASRSGQDAFLDAFGPNDRLPSATGLR